MKIRVYKTHWYRGGIFHWGQVRFNSGDVYTSYRLGPLLIHIRWSCLKVVVDVASMPPPPPKVFCVATMEHRKTC